MCAKKASPSTTNKAAASITSKSARPSSTNGKAASPAAAKVSTPNVRTLAPTDIGEVAGEIWQLLATSDGQTLAAIKKAIAAPGDVVAAAVGWLAREGKLEFATSGRTLKISLKP